MVTEKKLFNTNVNQQNLQNGNDSYIKVLQSLPDEKVINQINALYNRGFEEVLIVTINNISTNVQKLCLTSNPKLIKYINNPSEEIKEFMKVATL